MTAVRPGAAERRAAKERAIDVFGGLLPVTMMLFALSAMFILDGQRDNYIGGHWYVAMLNGSAGALRIALPSVLVIQFATAAFFIAREWRSFSVFPDVLDKALPAYLLFWPVCILYTTYTAAILAYAHFAWIYESCASADTLAGMRDGFHCHLTPNFGDQLEFAGDQFLRGLWGDFYELVGPADPAHSVTKDAVFVITTGVFRLYAQSALFTLPASAFFVGRLFFRRVLASQ